MSNENADTAEPLQRIGQRLAALERHVFEQDKEMLALSRQLEQLRRGLVGLRERLSEPSGDDRGVGRMQDGGLAHDYATEERPPHY